MKTLQRIHDEAVLKWAGFLGHTFFEVSGEGIKASVQNECSTLESALRKRSADSRIYQKISKRRYKKVG